MPSEASASVAPLSSVSVVAPRLSFSDASSPSRQRARRRPAARTARAGRAGRTVHARPPGRVTPGVRRLAARGIAPASGPAPRCLRPRRARPRRRRGARPRRARGCPCSRSARRASTAPTIAKPAPTRKASWKPSVSAVGSACGSPPAGAITSSVARVRDRGEDRQAERAADLLRRVDQPARQAGLARSTRRSPRRSSSARTRSRGRPRRAATGTGCRTRTCRPARPGRTRSGPAAVSSSPATSVGLKPTRVTSTDATPAAHDDPDRQRQVREPRLQRVVAQHLLHVQRDEEEHREQRHRDEQRDDVGAGQRPVAEDPERDERARRAQLDGDERADQRERDARSARASGSSPSRR